MRSLLSALLVLSTLGIASAQAPAPSLDPSTARYNLNVTVGVRSPDCFSRPVVLVNGQFLNTTIEVVQGQTLEVTVHNNIPADFPSVSDGISIHWHGFDQRGNEWWDGVAYITQCPIATGTSFTYRFTVNDPPGTYMWHGHAGVERVDGFQGPLIVRPAGPDPFASLYDEEVIIPLDDWYHDLYSSLTYATSRPFDDSKVTATSGRRSWVDNPQSVLINGQGFYGDCALLQGGNSVPPVCNVTTATVAPGRSLQNPQTGQINQGCKHFNLTVEPGKRYRLRLLNFASLLMLTFYVEGHTLDIIAADATPTEILNVASLDINSGQRYDVILTANAPDARTYFIVAQQQYRPGSPAGYGFLTYKNSNVSALPPTATPASNATLPWTLAQTSQVVTANYLVHPETADEAEDIGAALAGRESLAVPGNVSVEVFLNISQPVLPNGQLHWAFNDVASYKTPGCTTLLDELYTSRRGYLELYDVQTTNAPAIDYSLKQRAEPNDLPQVYVFGEAASVLTSPVTGQYIVELLSGDVVEIVVQNLPGNSSGGDQYLVTAAPSLLAGRGNQEQHPLHLHGHHVWVVGTGNGTYNSSSKDTYNLENAIFRDVFTVPRGGWTAVRFVADNPGAWDFHCHLSIHLYMGQQLIFAEAIDEISEPPPDLPTCPSSCTANFAGWSLDYVAKTYGNSGFLKK